VTRPDDQKICLVSSCGGHLAELRALRGAYEEFQYFYVLNDRIELSGDMPGRTYFIVHSERDVKTLWNLVEAFRILRRERPDLILSTGAGPAVPFALAGKLLGIPNVFVEISAQVERPSLTGRIMYRLADRFYYQWPQLERFFPRATCGGLLL
jgi:UDP-N-acetylglucosamine:LPS N-acetylglucosamine transferase